MCRGRKKSAIPSLRYSHKATKYPQPPAPCTPGYVRVFLFFLMTQIRGPEPSSQNMRIFALLGLTIVPLPRTKHLVESKKHGLVSRTLESGRIYPGVLYTKGLLNLDSKAGSQIGSEGGGKNVWNSRLEPSHSLTCSVFLDCLSHFGAEPGFVPSFVRSLVAGVDI